MRFHLLISAIFILLFNVNSNGQTDSLKLYTKQGCGNCKFAKEQFNKHSVNFIEYGLEDKANVKQMFNYLNKIGYKGKILMPIMVLNNQVYHPIYQFKDTLQDIALSSAIDSILIRVKVDQLHLAYALHATLTNDSVLPKDDSDCEAHITPIYLVFKNFVVKNDALIFVQQLQNQGFKNAGVIEYQRFFRVYSNYFLNQQQANDELLKVRANNEPAYLLSVN